MVKFKNVLLILLTIIFLGFLFLFFNRPSIIFDSVVWKNKSTEKRYEMAEDLLKKNSLYGLNKNQVIELLGTPDSEAEEPRTLIYIIRLGGRYLVFNQVYSLDILFEENWEHVSSAGIRGD